MGIGAHAAPDHPGSLPDGIALGRRMIMAGCRRGLRPGQSGTRQCVLHVGALFRTRCACFRTWEQDLRVVDSDTSVGSARRIARIVSNEAPRSRSERIRSAFGQTAANAETRRAPSSARSHSISLSVGWLMPWRDTDAP